MSGFMRWLTRFLKDEDGPTGIEYAFMTALIIVVCLLAIGLLGHETSDLFDHSATEISGS